MPRQVRLARYSPVRHDCLSNHRLLESVQPRSAPWKIEGWTTISPSAINSKDLISRSAEMSWQRSPQAPAFSAASMSSGAGYAARMTAFTPGVVVTTRRTRSTVVELHLSDAD